MLDAAEKQPTLQSPGLPSNRQLSGSNRNSLEGSQLRAKEQRTSASRQLSTGQRLRERNEGDAWKGQSPQLFDL